MSVATEGGRDIFVGIVREIEGFPEIRFVVHPKAGHALGCDQQAFAAEAQRAIAAAEVRLSRSRS